MIAMPKRRVTFWFDTDSEVRYVSAMPELGDHVTHAHELWLVSRVGEDDIEQYVICRRPRGAGTSPSEEHSAHELA